MMDISERSFEEAIEQGLLQHGPDAAADAGMARETLSPYGDDAGGLPSAAARGLRSGALSAPARRISRSTVDLATGKPCRCR